MIDDQKVNIIEKNTIGFITFRGSPRCSSTKNAGAIASSTDLKPHLHRKHKITLTNYDSY